MSRESFIKNLLATRPNIYVDWWQALLIEEARLFENRHAA
jgi:hypothetical protein